ncbi:MAG TPA: bifunctional metallophosphatase/5'-nucleotidase [Firmicutes bacterium]|nr:bifunctional metallophosphatase/5'-nucleotidase [Bacillota bacterium]
MRLKLKFLIIPLIFIVLFSVSVLSETGKLLILHTNDIHGVISHSTAFWMNPSFPPPIGGAASAVALIKNIREEAAREGYEVLVMDAGDIWQGTPVGDKTQAMATIKYFELAGYDVWALGNHDFDAGWEVAKMLTESSPMPVVCSNIIDTTTGAMPTWKNLYPYIIVERGDLKIGILGAITDDMNTLVSEDKLGPIRFPKVGLTIPKYIKELREVEKVDLVIGLFHTGISYTKEEKYLVLKEWQKEADAKGLVYGTDEYTNFIYEKKGFGLQDHEIADLVPGLDVIVGGHSHSGLYPPWEDPRNHTIVVQAYSKLSSIGQLELTYDRNTKQIVNYRADNFTLFSDEIPPDKETDLIISEMVNDAESGMKIPIATSRTPITRGNDETLLGNLITDAIKERFDMDVVLFNRGGMRADLPDGDITEMDIYQVLPFGNSIVTMEVSGLLLKEILEVGVSGRRRDTQLAGVKLVYNPNFPEKERITELRINGEPLDLNKTYKFATSDYLAQGAVGYYMFAFVEENDFTGVTIRSSVIEYVKKHTPLDVKLEGRIRRNEKAQYSQELIKLNEDVKSRELEIKDARNLEMDYR